MKRRWAEHWARNEYRVPVAHPELISALEDTVGDLRHRKILEVGAGMGGDSIAMARRGGSLYAIDYLAEALHAIREFALSEGVPMVGVQADALALPFRDETFDAVFHQGLLEHFQPAEQGGLLRENWRVLKRGGILVVDVPQRYSEYTSYKRRLMREGTWFAGWETELSVQGLGHLLRRAGFRVVRFYPRGYFGVVGRMRQRFSQEPPHGRGKFVPFSLRALYRRLWEWLEGTPLALYLCWSIGAVAEKLYVEG